ncbi:hypothetical protein [Thermofilum sp.]|uniref:hypothetical protein n=1 Tax=Thermofilum sp. TaxID=1961369 RepID=UPI00316E3CBF
MKAVIYILKGGLKLYSPPSSDEKSFYWDPVQEKLYPLNVSLNGFTEYLFVDSNIVTGGTVRKAVDKLAVPWEKVRVRGNPRTCVAKHFVDEPVEDPVPCYDRILLVFSGKAGTLKSFLARGLESVHGIPVIQVGKTLKSMVDLGEYGEKLYEREKVNPFVVGELLYPILSKKSDPIVILDGVKRMETVVFLGYSTRRPAFVFFLQNDENIRRTCVRLRNDPDDFFDAERNYLFMDHLNLLLREAYAVIDWRDWSTLEPLTELLKVFGYRTTRLCSFPNPFGSKRPLLELYRRNVEKIFAGKMSVDEGVRVTASHTRYLERLAEKGVRLDKIRSKIIVLTASAFRIVDDILDENTVRDNMPAAWTVHGIIDSVRDAVMITGEAWKLSNHIGLGDDFVRMFRRVVDAVMYELEVEDGVRGFNGFEDWLKAAEREAAFREFLAILSGHPDRVQEFRMWGIEAQAKDDLMGENKGGREGTERRLNRPLFKSEWLPLLNSMAREGNVR